MCLATAFAGLSGLAAGSGAALLTFSGYLWRRDFMDHKARDDEDSAFHKSEIKTHEGKGERALDIMAAWAETKRGTVADLLQSFVTKEQPHAQGRSISLSLEKQSGVTRKSLTRGSTMDMKLSDIKLSFPEFFYIVCSHGVRLISKVTFGLGKTVLRKKMSERGLIDVPEADLPKTIGSLCLETALLINIADVKVEEVTNSEGADSPTPVNATRPVATFAWYDLPSMDNDGTFKVLTILTIKVDLLSKRMLQCKLNEDIIPVEDVMPLIMFAWIVNHYKMHCVGNWASNVEHVDKELRYMSIMNTYVNYLGDSLPVVFTMERALGVLRKDYAPSLATMIRYLEDQGVRFHGGVRSLLPYSKLAKFVIGIRGSFMKLFAAHRSEMYGIDSEALFVSCVVHPLDHAQLSKIVPDPLWFRSERYDGMAEVVRTCVGPALHNKQTHLVRESRLPFFRALYDQAKALDEDMANMLEVGMTA
jgi:hypothetical protein